jgi:hypothetical protein
MLIDHVGLILFPNIRILRLIGRLAFPLFSYSAARGYRSSVLHGTTRAQISRMTVFSVASQLPFAAMLFVALRRDFALCALNVGFLWLLALLSLFFLDMKKPSCIPIVFSFFLMSTAADYGIYGLSMTILFYYFSVKSFRPVLLASALLLLHVVFFSPFQIFALIGCSLLLLFSEYDNNVVILPKMFFYAFYPVHICVFLILKIIF